MSPSPLVVAAGRSTVLAGGAWFIASALGMRDVLGAGDALPLLAFLVVGAALGARGHERVVFGAFASLVVIMLIVGLTPVIPAIGSRLVREDGPSRVNAVVVLGAGVTEDGHVSESGVDRMLSGLTHVSSADTTPMVFSVVRRRLSDTLTTERDIRRTIELAGGRHYVLLRNVFSTHDEATEVLALAARFGWQRVGLVTSPGHSGRACRTFEKAGVQVACWPSDEREARVAGATGISERITACHWVLYELLGWITYRLRGWI